MKENKKEKGLFAKPNVFASEAMYRLKICLGFVGELLMETTKKVVSVLRDTLLIVMTAVVIVITLVVCFIVCVVVVVRIVLWYLWTALTVFAEYGGPDT